MMTQKTWRIFKNHSDYEHGMNRFLELAEGELVQDTPDYDEFELLNLLIGHFEKNEYPMDKPDPIDAIKFRMDQQGLTQSDMTQFIGSASKVSEVLNRKRPLSLSMIRRVHDGLGIPVDILIQDVSAIEWNCIDSPKKTIEINADIKQENLWPSASLSAALIKYQSRNGRVSSIKSMARESASFVITPASLMPVTSELSCLPTTTLPKDIFSRLS